MRLNKKYKILELTITLKEGIDYAKKNGGDNAKIMLNDCVEALVCLSNIVKDENKASEFIGKVIDKIRNAIDLVYDDNLLRNSIDLIDEMINNLRYIIVHEIDTQIEVAFMPYKVSMWDALESIWIEAKKDVNCSSYVVPIPYYEKDAQGKFCKMCYEGNDFSKDIEITSYEDYDFENRQPEIIYIHNPYDQCNLLTMVDPRYFSSNLSKYTNMLVYVPYYVDGSYEDEIEHRTFGLLPGPINSTKIIAQSNMHKELFIANGHKPNKILDIGSPKFDATLLALKKDIEIPLEWESVIRNKKVFLFNSTLDDILLDTNWVNNVEKIFDSFINDDNCSVIWRPHPLTEITIKTLRPHFLEAFNQLQHKILSCNNIVIDLTGDAYKAIKISDALISGYSSITFQYMITEKPILSFMNKERLDKNRFYCVDYLGSYFTNEGVSISDFKEMVLNEKDPKKEERMKKFKNSVTNVDGTCGQKIYQNIKSELLDLLLI